MIRVKGRVDGRVDVRTLAAMAVAAMVLGVGGCVIGGGSPSSDHTTTSSATSVLADQIDCGTYFAASGWPTTMLPFPDTFQCIVRAFEGGTPARYVVREQTDGEGGHIAVTTYEVVAQRSAKVTVDRRNAQPPAGVSASRCSALTAPPAGLLQADDCVPAS